MAHKIPKQTDALLKRHLDEYGFVHLDIGCGANKQPKSIGIDIRQLPGVDIVQNLEQFPWPLPSDCASLATASHVIEHINPANFTFVKFMDEVWRLLKVGGQFQFSFPMGGSYGYWQDPTHVNGCNQATWYYFDPLAKDPAGNPINLYQIYRPKPWKVLACTWEASTGFMEVIMEKRKIDKSYGHEEKEYE